MTIPEQIKELQEHLNHFEKEKLAHFEEIRQIREREASGKIRGDEPQRLSFCNTRIKQLVTQISTKERVVTRLEKELEGSKQQSIFNL